MINTPLTPSKSHAPRMTGLLFALLMSVIGFPVFGQTAPATSCERELEGLMAQRDREIALAVHPIQKRFELATQQLLRKVLQSGDLEAANKLKAMIDQAGGVAGGNKVNGDNNMVRVEGGTLPKESALAGQPVSNFEIGKCEVTWGEWQKVRDWAVTKGYEDLKGVGKGLGENHPVTDVSWYDVVKWCNAKSEMERLAPVYQVNGQAYKAGDFGETGSHVVQIKNEAKGYRLPSEAEWEWAARGGKKSKGYTYSGSNDWKAVAWNWLNNSPSGTKAVGTKKENELQICDMSGNVWEWCWDMVEASNRRFRGGSWYNNPDIGLVSVRDNGSTYDSRRIGDRSHHHGFRLARSSGN